MCKAIFTYSRLIIWVKASIILAFLLFASSSLVAQTHSYTFKAIHNQISLSENCALLPDSNNRSFSYVKKHPEEFKPLVSVAVDKNKAYWGKIAISPKKERNVTMILDLGNADTLFVFLPNKQGDYKKMVTGKLVATTDNDEILPNSNLLKIDIPSHKQFHKFDIYFWTKNKFGNTISPKLYDVGYVFKQTAVEGSREKLKMGVYLGILFFISILTLTLYFFNFDRIYLYYGLFILFHALFNISIFQLSIEFVLGNAREYNFIFGEISGYFYWIMFMFFMQEFAETKKMFPKEHKAMQLIQISAIFFLVYGIISLSANLAPNLYINLRNSYLILIWVISVVVFIRLGFSCSTNARIIGIGGIPLAIGWLLYISLSMLEMGKAAYLFQIGQVSEIMIFTYGLAYRFRQKDLDKQQSQEELILQLKKIRKMEAEAVEQLEVKVKARTEEIQTQNEKLQHRHQEIIEQRNQIKAQRDEIELHRSELEEQTQWFLQQNSEISASIHYARRLQKALLPTQAEINATLPENFIFYIPRDIVSGDFYWVQQVYSYTVVVAADCTGHGVPGAFMSLIGISALNDIVMHREFTNPGLILDEMRSYVKRTLKQTGKEEEANDGIDLALSVIDIKNRELWYAGAFNPLVIVRNKELIEVKADRMPVGVYYKKDEPFTTHEVKLQEGDNLYMYSDGFPDQIGGEKEKKYKSRNFKKLLVELSHLPMVQQKEQLFKTYLNWKSGLEQVDDILVMGMHIE